MASLKNKEDCNIFFQPNATGSEIFLKIQIKLFNNKVAALLDLVPKAWFSIARKFYLYIAFLYPILCDNNP